MRSTSHARARLVGAVVAFTAVMAATTPAHAHTDFDFSLPTDGASVGEPVSEVTVAFTSPVTLVGNGFEVLDPQENVLQPFAVTDDDTLFRLQFDPPLAGGTVGVRYTVIAGDGHTLSGGFSFTVGVDLPPPTTAAPTLPPVSQPEPEPEPEPEPDTTTTVVAPAEVLEETSAAAETAAPTTVQEAADDTGPQVGSDEPARSRLAIWIAAAVALLAAVFLAIRARTEGRS